LINKIGFIRQKEFRKNAKKYVGLLNIDTPSLNQEVRYLSGGNQQKVIVSRLIGSEPRLLLMLDPTAGIDVEAKQEIYKIMQELTSRGISILLLSSDLNELIDLSDRILVMHNGKIVKEFKEHNVERHEIQIASEGII
jgi:ABC-type sugar transport system ATPase subunit